jgi:hypothetical protein
MLGLARHGFEEVLDHYPQCRSGEDYLSGIKYCELGAANPTRPTLPDTLNEFESRLDELRSIILAVLLNRILSGQ